MAAVREERERLGDEVRFASQQAYLAVLWCLFPIAAAGCNRCPHCAMSHLPAQHLLHLHPDAACSYAALQRPSRPRRPCMQPWSLFAHLDALLARVLELHTAQEPLRKKVKQDDMSADLQMAVVADNILEHALTDGRAAIERAASHAKGLADQGTPALPNRCCCCTASYA